MANNDIIFARGLTGRGLPGKQADNIYNDLRLSRYGELQTQALLGSKLYPLADEGQYFVARNPTAGTGIADAAAQTSISDTAPVAFMHNNDALGGKRIYLDFMRLEVTAAGTAGTNLRAAFKVDSGNTRYTSGGTALTVVNPNMDSGSVSVVDQLFFGAITAAAATGSVRQVYQALCRTVIPVVGDVYLFTFGSSSSPATSGMVLEGTAQLERHIMCPPIVIGPQQQLTFHEFSASQSAAKSFEITMGWWER